MLLLRYLTFNDLRAKLGGRGRMTIYRYVEAGRLPKPILLGGRNYWVESDVDAAMAKLGTAGRSMQADQT